MISRKELSYVDLWPKNVPYPGIDYCEYAIKELEECLVLFQEEYLNKVYNVTFSNNEEIEFQILPKNICHMLGIDFQNLSKDYFDLYRKDILRLPLGVNFSSYDLVNTIVNQKDRILEFDEKRKGAKGVNYYKVAIKCAIFKKLADLSAFNYGCLNFDKDTFFKFNPNKTHSSNSTRLLYTPSEEVVSPYYMMGLISENNDDKYLVETLIAPTNVGELFRQQEVVIPTQILTDDGGVLIKKQATPAEKIKLLKDYQSIINTYGIISHLNIYGDYLSQLMSAEKENQSKLVLK